MNRDKHLQRLILLQIRDGAAPSGLAKYSEQQQLHNCALLIQDGFVKGEVIRGTSGICVSALTTELTSKGHDFLDETDPQKDPQTQPFPIPKVLSFGNPRLIFISHSAADKDIADALVDLLCSALRLGASDFLCTSVEGAKLPGGAQTDAVLRAAIRDFPAFLSILTPSAVTSTYVLFELGARWGTEKSHIPLLAKGAGSEVLKEPLKATNALNLGHEADVLQLIQDLSSVLGCQPEAPQAYHRKMLRVVEVSRKSEATAEPAPASPRSHQAQPLPAALTSPPSLSDDAQKLLVEAFASVDGYVSKLRSANIGEVVNIHTPNQDFLGKRDDPRVQARWVHAFNELVQKGCFATYNHDGLFRITHLGYELADATKKRRS